MHEPKPLVPRVKKKQEGGLAIQAAEMRPGPQYGPLAHLPAIKPSRATCPEPLGLRVAGIALNVLDGARINQWKIVPLFDFRAIGDGVTFIAHSQTQTTLPGEDIQTILGKPWVS